MFAAFVLSIVAILAQNPAPEAGKPMPQKPVPVVAPVKPSTTEIPASANAENTSQGASQVKAVPVAEPAKPVSTVVGAKVAPIATGHLDPAEFAEYQPKPILVKSGSIPEFAYIEGIKDGKLIVYEAGPPAFYPVMKTKTEQQTKIQADGSEVIENITITTNEPSDVVHPKVQQLYDLAVVEVYDLNGSPIAQERWEDLFAKPILVFLTHSHIEQRKPIDPAYFKLARKDMPFVVLSSPPPGIFLNGALAAQGMKRPPARAGTEKDSILAVDGEIIPHIGVVEGIRNQKLIFLDRPDQVEVAGVTGGTIKYYRKSEKNALAEKARKLGVPLENVLESTWATSLTSRTVREQHNLEKVRIYDKTGTPIPRNQWPTLLAKPRLVVFARESDLRIDPVYLAALRDDTPLLVLPTPGKEEYAIDLDTVATTPASTATIPPTLGTDTQTPSAVNRSGTGEARPAPVRPATGAVKPKGIKRPAPVAKFTSGGTVPHVGIVDGLQDGKLLFRENGPGDARTRREWKDLDEVSIYTAQGAPLPRESWPTVFARPAFVLFARCGLDNEIPIDPAYLAVPRDQVPVVVLNDPLPDEIETIQVPASIANQDEPRPVLARGGMAPGISVVDGVRDGQLQFRQIKNEPNYTTVAESEQRTQTVNGRTVSIPIQVLKQKTRFVVQNERVPYDLEGIEIYDWQGVPVARQHWEQLFQTPGIVLFARKGINTPVDPAFLAAAREGTFLVVLPETNNNAPAPAPASDTLRPSTPASTR